MDNKYDEQFIIMQAKIETNKQYMKTNKQDSDEKMMKLTEYFKAMLTSTIVSMMDHINMLKYSPTQSYSPKPQDPTTAILDNRRYPPLEGGHSTKIGGMWNLKHEISSPKLYELLIKTELKVETPLDLNNFFNHIKMCLNAVTRLQEDLLPSCQYFKRHSEYEEYFIPYRDHPSSYWNAQIYTSLGHSLLVSITYDTCVKSSMEPQAYNFVSTHAHKISGWKILSRLFYSRSPHIGGMNGDVRSDLATLAFKNREQLEDFHSRIIIL